MMFENVCRQCELPDENAWGEEIDWMWVVYRPASTSELGREVLLGTYDNPDNAKQHAQKASKQRPCAIKEIAVHDIQRAFESNENMTEQARAQCPKCGFLNVAVMTAPRKPPKMVCTNCHWDSLEAEREGPA